MQYAMLLFSKCHLLMNIFDPPTPFILKATSSPETLSLLPAYLSILSAYLSSPHHCISKTNSLLWNAAYGPEASVYLSICLEGWLAKLLVSAINQSLQAVRRPSGQRWFLCQPAVGKTGCHCSGGIVSVLQLLTSTNAAATDNLATVKQSRLIYTNFSLLSAHSSKSRSPSRTSEPRKERVDICRLFSGVQLQI